MKCAWLPRLQGTRSSDDAASMHMASANQASLNDFNAIPLTQRRSMSRHCNGWRRGEASRQPVINTRTGQAPQCIRLQRGIRSPLRATDVNGRLV